MVCSVVKKMEDVYYDKKITVTEHCGFQDYMGALLRESSMEMLEELKDRFTLESYRQLARNEIKKRKGRCVI